MNLASEISVLETELAALKTENKILKEAKLILEFENDQLKRRLTYTEASRDSHLAGKVRLKTILDQAGQHLVSGIQHYNADLARNDPEELRFLPEEKAAE